MQNRSKSHGYRLRCLDHAQRYGQDKVKSQSGLLRFFVISLLFTVPASLINLDEENPARLISTMLVVIMAVIYFERQNHLKKLKALEEPSPKNSKDDGTGKN